MSHDIKAQLKGLKHTAVNPREDWLQNNRALLLSQVRNTVGAKHESSFNLNQVWSALSIFLPTSFVYNVMRPVAVLAIVLMVGTSGWIATVDASFESLPGDTLYGAKRAVEKTQLALTSLSGNKTAETKLHATFALRRVSEVKKISVSSDPVKQAKVPEAMADLKTEIQAVNNSLDQVKPVVSADTIKDVKKDTEEVKAVLETIKDNLQSAPISSESLAAVSEAKDLAKDTAVKAVEIIVDKHLAGDTSVTKEEVKKELDKTLASAATDITENKQNIEGVKTIVDAVTTEVKGLVADSKTLNSSVSTGTAQNLTAQMTEIASTTKAAAIQTDAAAVDGDKKIAEAKILIGNNDLAQAVAKVKEITAVSKSAEKIKDDALQTVQNVLPIVSVVKDAPMPVSPTSTKIEVKIATSTEVTSTTLPVQIIVSSTAHTAANTMAPAMKVVVPVKK